jgi:hypothetical protein
MVSSTSDIAGHYPKTTGGKAMTAFVGHRCIRATTLTATLAATVALSLAACAPPRQPAEMSLKFEPIKLQMSVKERSNFTASPSVMINGTKHAIAYNNLLKPGDKLDGVVFGQLVDINGAPMVNKDGSPNICDKPDFMSLLTAGGKVFMINQFECRPAAMYLTELSQDSATGALAPVSTRPIDFSGVNGAARHCAGMVTPWNTHLSSEEDVRDARKLKADGTLDKQYTAIAKYLAGKPASPYMWGWVPEVAILNGAGDTRVVTTPTARWRCSSPTGPGISAPAPFTPRNGRKQATAVAPANSNGSTSVTRRTTRSAI